MPGKIDDLEIEITASSNSAVNKISELAGCLRELRDSVSESGNQKLDQFVTILKRLKDVGKVTFPTTLAKNIKAFSDTVDSLSVEKTKAMVTALEGFKNLSDVKFSTTIAKGLGEVAAVVDSMTDQSIERIDRLTTSLQRLAGVNLSGLSRAAKLSSGGNEVLPVNNNTGGASGGEADQVVPEAGRLANVLGRVRDSAKGAGDAIRTAFMTSLTKSFKPLETFKDKLVNLVNQFKRVLMYRAIRTIIKDIGEAFKTGVNNLYEYSRATEMLANGSFAKSMNDGATALLYFKNALGASVAPLIMSFISWLDALIDKIVVAINWINQLFAKLTGRDYWYKAKKVATEYAGAAKAAGGAAKEALKYLLPFDELNILPSEKNGGGGSGAATPDFSEMFERMETFDGKFEWIDKLSEKINKIKEDLNLEGFFSELKVRIGNLLFEDSTNLSPDDKFYKVMDAIFGIAGAVIGGLVAGPVGAGLGLLLGVALSTFISRLIKPKDGTNLSNKDKALLVISAIFGLAGAAVGAIYGGPVGAGVGLFLGASLTGIMKQLFFKDKSGLGDEEVAGKLIAGSALTGIFAFTGLITGGLGGMLIGLAVGVALTMLISSIDFKGLGDKIEQARHDLQTAVGSLSVGNDLETMGASYALAVMQNAANAAWNPKEKIKSQAGTNLKKNLFNSSNDNTRIMQELEKLTRGYATGGFPEDGLFFANHGELVGKFANGRTAVANNDQIVAGIAQGVEEANEPVVSAIMTAASQIISHMGKNGVSMDDLARNVTKWQNRNARAMGY